MRRWIQAALFALPAGLAACSAAPQGETLATSSAALGVNPRGTWVVDNMAHDLVQVDQPWALHFEPSHSRYVASLRANSASADGLAESGEYTLTFDQGVLTRLKLTERATQRELDWQVVDFDGSVLQLQLGTRVVSYRRLWVNCSLDANRSESFELSARGPRLYKMEVSLAGPGAQLPPNDVELTLDFDRFYGDPSDMLLEEGPRGGVTLGLPFTSVHGTFAVQGRRGPNRLAITCEGMEQF